MRSLMILALALVSTAAYAETYVCSGVNTTGIYSLTVDGGTATLTADGGTYTATGAGSDYLFDSTFALGDVSFIATPTLHLPTDGSMSDPQFNASIDDDAGDRADLSCSQ